MWLFHKIPFGYNYCSLGQFVSADGLKVSYVPYLFHLTLE